MDTLAVPARAGIRAELAGAAGGIVAGTAYLVAQVTFAQTVHGGAWTEPLQRIAAILLGPDAAPPPGDMSTTIFGMAVFIHLVLSVAYGRLICLLARRAGAMPPILVGALAGAAIYGLHFWLIAPEAFPWFEQSRTLTTAMDHVLFGAIAAVAGTHLSGRKQIT